MNQLLESPKEKKEKPQIPNIDFQLCSTLTTQQFQQQNSILSTASSTKTSSFLAIPSPNLSCNASFPLLQRGASTSSLWQRSNSHDLSGNTPPLESSASNLFSPTTASKKGKQHFTFPDGGWVCSACQNYNFYGKSESDSQEGLNATDVKSRRRNMTLTESLDIYLRKSSRARSLLRLLTCNECTRSH